MIKTVVTGCLFLASLFLLSPVTSQGATAETTQDTTPKYCSNWSAWRNAQPTDKPSLHVKGVCTFPTTGYSVQLRPAESPGINPNIYVIEVIVHIPVDRTARHPVTVDATYDEQTDKKYSEVQLIPDNVTVKVKDVSAANQQLSDGEQAISGCIRIIEDCPVLVSRDGHYYHLAGASDVVDKAEAAKTLIKISATPGSWDEVGAKCKRDNVTPVVITSLSVTRMRCAPESGASPSTFKKDAPCGDWIAWHETDDSGKSTLNVRGSCMFSTGGYSAELKPAPLHGGVYYKDRQLNLTITSPQPGGIVTQVLTPCTINYSEVTTRTFTSVTINPGNVKVMVKDGAQPAGSPRASCS
jgi:hypothetical protein